MSSFARTGSRPCRALVVAVLVAGACAGAGPSTAWAEEPPTFADRSDESLREPDRGFAFLVNPLAMAMGIFGAEADWALGRFVAVAFDGAVMMAHGEPALAVGAGLLLYPMGAVHRGLFVEPRLVYARPVAEPVTQLDLSTDVAGIGAVAGWQWTWDYGLTLRLGGGVLEYFGGPRRVSSAGALAVGPSVVADGSVGWVF